MNEVITIPVWLAIFIFVALFLNVANTIYHIWRDMEWRDMDE